jgi:hypothetical protein
MTVLTRHKLFPTANINNTPTLVFGTEVYCRLDSIRIVNNSNNNILVDIKLLREISEVPRYFNIFNHANIDPYGCQDLLSIDYGGLIYVEPGDILFGNSDFSKNKFDCLISYREVLNDTFVF